MGHLLGTRRTGCGTGGSLRLVVGFEFLRLDYHQVFEVALLKIGG